MMKRLQSLAKTRRPIFDTVLNRSRLFENLDCSKSTSLSWINAPAGAGKTTLVASYLQERKLDCVWYSCKNEDNDLSSLFYHLGLACKHKYQLWKGKLPSLQPEHQLGVSNFGIIFFQELFSKISTQAVLVLDDFHCINANSLLHTILSDSLAYLPDQLNVIIISRHVPPPVYAHLRADKKLLEIPIEKFAFTLKEAEDLAKLVIPEKILEKATLKKVRDKTQGWAAGLILLLEQLRGESSHHVDIDEIDQEHIFDYFASEYFNNLSQTTKEFLVITSLLKSFSAKEARKLTKNQDAHKILHNMSSRQFLTSRQGHFQPVYKFHPLLREFLLLRLEDTCSAARIFIFKNKAASLLADAGHWNNAAIIYHQIENSQSLIKLLLKHAKTAIKQGRHSILQGWISSLPDAVIGQQPWLAYWLGMSKLQFEPDSSRPYFEMAIDKFMQSGNAKGAYLSWAGIANSYVLALNSFKGARKWVDVLNHMRKQWPRFPSVEARIQVTFSMLNLLSHISVDYDEINDWVLRAEKLYHFVPVKKLRVALSLGLIIHNNVAGKIGKVRKLANYNHTIGTDANMPPLERILAYTGITISGWAAPLPNDIDSLAALDSALEIAKKSGIHVMDSILLIQGLHLLLQKNEIKKAQEFLSKLQYISETKHFIIRAFYYVMTSHIEAECGNHSTALEYLIDAVAIVEEHAPNMMPEIPFRAVLALQLSEVGRYDESAEHMAKAEKLSKKLKSKLGKLMLGCFKAIAAYRQKDYTTTAKLLKSSLKIGRQEGMTGFGHWRPSLMAEMLQFALEQDIETEYACTLIRLSKIFPAEPPLHIPKWPWSIKTTTLGGFELQLQGEIYNSKAKTQNKPLELLKAVISSDGQRTDIMDKLWPDSDGDAAKSAFDSTLSRLRTLLNDKQALILCNGRLSINPTHCYLDTSALDQVIIKAKEENQPDKLTKIVEQILVLYKGQFLPEDQASWLIQCREEIQIRVIRCLGTICQKISHTSCENMDELLERILKIAPHSEIFYQHLMQFYLEQDRIADLIAIYRRCEKSLKIEFGIAPSKKTQQLYTQALGNL